MKFTVGMLDASAVFIKDGSAGSSKPGLSSTVKGEQEYESPGKVGSGQQVGPVQQNHHPVSELEIMDFPSSYLPAANEVSPSVPSVGHSHSTDMENAYTYEDSHFPTSNFTTLATDIRPAWSEFAESVNFTGGEVQDWSLDELYNFENMHVPGVEDVLGRRVVEEYDESGNNFAGF